MWVTAEGGSSVSPTGIQAMVTGSKYPFDAAAQDFLKGVTHKNVIKEIQQKPLGHLTIVCARPGDGRRDFTLELANDLATQDFSVCYCSITRTKKYLQKKLLPNVHILSALPKDDSYFFKKIKESACERGVFVLIDELSSFVLQKRLKQAPIGAYDKAKVQKDLLLYLKDLAVQQGIHIVVAVTFAHTSDTDDMLPISKEVIEFSDRTYILYKDSITADTLWCTDEIMLKLKEVEKN